MYVFFLSRRTRRAQDELNTTREICDDLFGEVQSPKTSKTVVEIHCESDVSADQVRARIRDAYATAQRLQVVERKLKEVEPEIQRLRRDVKKKTEALTTMRARWMEETSNLQDKIEKLNSRTLVERHRKLKRHAESLELKLKEIMDSNRDLANRLSESNEVSQRLQRELSPLYDVDRRLRVSQESVEMLEQRVDEFRDRELETQHKLATLRERCERLQEEKRRIVERDVTSLRDEVFRLNQKQKKSLIKLETCSKTESDLKARLEKSERENQKLRKEIHQLHTTFSSSDGRRKNTPNLVLPISSKTRKMIRELQNRVQGLEWELKRRTSSSSPSYSSSKSIERLEMERDQALKNLRERDEECERFQKVLNIIMGEHDFEEEEDDKVEVEKKTNNNIVVEFSEPFLGFTLLSTENTNEKQHPAIISKFQRFEDGTMGPAESCGLLGVGDALVSIDDKSVLGMKYDEVVSELRKAGRPVRIEWSRKFYRPTKLVSLSSIRSVRVVSHTTTPKKKNDDDDGDDDNNKDEKKDVVADDDTIFHPPSPLRNFTATRKVEEEVEWTRHRISTLPLKQLDLNSESVRVALKDLPQTDALKDWLNVLLNSKSSMPHNLQRGIEFRNLSPTTRNTFMLVIVPMLQRLRNVNLSIWKRSRVDVLSDLRLRVEHSS